MEYITETGRKYSLRYQELREDYHRYKDMSDDDFIANVLDILHFCCIVSYLKETSSQILLGDEGIIHELIHLVTIYSLDKNEIKFKLGEIRKNFNVTMQLA